MLFCYGEMNKYYFYLFSASCSVAQFLKANIAQYKPCYFCNNAHTAYFLFILKPVKKHYFTTFSILFTLPVRLLFLHTLQGMLFHKFKYPVHYRSYKNRNEYSCGKVDYAVKI